MLNTRYSRENCDFHSKLLRQSKVASFHSFVIATKCVRVLAHEYVLPTRTVVQRLLHFLSSELKEIPPLVRADVLRQTPAAFCLIRRTT